jgi:hypothetical protein
LENIDVILGGGIRRGEEKGGKWKGKKEARGKIEIKLKFRGNKCKRGKSKANSVLLCGN